MIQQVTIRGFKRLKDVPFNFPGHIVLAGPNNAGKTTVLQAVAAWGLAMYRWRSNNDFQKRKNAYSRVPITRQQFSAVPLRAFEHLWHQRTHADPIEIDVIADGNRLGFELIWDSPEQIYVRPLQSVDPAVVKKADIKTVYVPAMTGLSPEEPVHQRPYLDYLLGLGRPGELLRNLLVEAAASEETWRALFEAVKRLFGYELQAPAAGEAFIRAEYRVGNKGPLYDIGSAGSGFQQVLMLLTFLYTRSGSVLLLDEPDAHLHMILQSVIYEELRSVAARNGSQLVIATHSEVIIDSVDPHRLCMMVGEVPRMLVTDDEQKRLGKALKYLHQTDILLAIEAPGVFYTEDYTDVYILREWARILAHPAEQVLQKVLWRKNRWAPRDGDSDIGADKQHELFRLVKPDLAAVELLDRDNNPNLPDGETKAGILRLRWNRYEIESYLVHPSAFERFVEKQLGGPKFATAALEDVRKYFAQQLPMIVADPLRDHVLLKGIKASVEIIPAILHTAGLPEFRKADFYQIAAEMKPEEIPDEVRAKLDVIVKAFPL